jgi:DNA-binding transcriptional LysR family regulator
MNVTQSAVSQQIRQLEMRLGYPLFVRQSRGLRMTDKGQILHATMSRAFNDINHTVIELSSSNVTLQVSCLPSLALQWLMPRLSEFHLHAPGVAVRLQAEFQSLDRLAMDTNEIDIALRYDPVEYDQLHADTILDEYLIPVATPEYLAQHPELAAGKSLEGVVLLHDAEPWVGAAEYIEWRTWLEVACPEWIERMDGPQFNLSSLAISAALNHQGVAMGRTALVYDDLMSRRLVKVSSRYARAPARYVLLCRNPDDRRVTLFSKWLKAECNRFRKARMQLLAA